MAINWDGCQPMAPGGVRSDTHPRVGCPRALLPVFGVTAIGDPSKPGNGKRRDCSYDRAMTGAAVTKAPPSTATNMVSTIASWLRGDRNNA